MPTIERIYRKDIPKAIIAESKNIQWSIDENGVQYLDGTYALGFRMEENSQGEKSPIYRIFRLEYNAEGPLNYQLNENDLNEGWQLGYAIKRETPNIEYEYMRQALLTDNNGYRLEGRIQFESGNLNDLRENWYRNTDIYNYLLNDAGKIVGISVISVLSTSFGSKNQFVLAETDLTTNNLDSGVEFKYSPNYFEDHKIEPISKQKLTTALYGDFGLINPDYNPNDPNWIKLIKDAREFKNRQYALTSYLSEDKITELRILNNDLKIANSYKKPGDENIYSGLGRYDIQFYLDKIFIKTTDIKEFNKKLDYYGFCSLIDPDGGISLDNLKYDNDKDIKQRFCRILEMLQSITIDDLSETSNDFDKFKFSEFINIEKLVNNLKETLFKNGLDNKYQNSLFNSDGNFNNEGDLSLAQEIAWDCIKIFGRETFFKMLTGTLYKKTGDRLIFTEHSQDEFFIILNHLQISLEYEPFAPQQKQITHIQNLYRNLMKFQPIKIELPTNNPSLEDNNKRTIIIPGIPIENIMPLYPEPQTFINSYPQSLSHYYNALTGDLSLEFSNVYRQLNPEGGSFLDDFVLDNHMTRLYIEEMNQLQVFGIIEGFNQYKIHGLEKTSFIRASEMSSDNPLLITNPISRIYYLDKGYHRYDGKSITGGSGLEHDFQRHVYEQLEEWGINDHEELAELILSTIANPYGDVHKMGIIDDINEPGKLTVYYRIHFNGKIRYLRVVFSKNVFNRFIVTCYDGEKIGSDLFKNYYNIYNLKDPYNIFK
jgi:hypothetical protein